MTREKAIKVLTAHNIWRHRYSEIQDSIEVGRAINFAVTDMIILQKLFLIHVDPVASEPVKQLTILSKTEKQDETPGSAPN
jgi:hypothetical protein